VNRTTIDPSRFSSHRGLNLFQTVLLLGLMTGYAGVASWLLWGADGLWFLLVWGAILLFFSPQLSGRWILRMYGARYVPPEQAAEYHHALAILASRASLPRPPTLWWVPSSMVNAFAVGSRDASAIAVTDGLLRTLLAARVGRRPGPRNRPYRPRRPLCHGTGRRHLAPHFGHELRRPRAIFLSLPQALAGGDVDWWPLIPLAAAPQVNLLAQLGLSRTREFDADLTAARLTDDPEALASALVRLERVQNGFLRRIFFPGRGLPEPSWLRTHPTTEERVHASHGPAQRHTGTLVPRLFLQAARLSPRSPAATPPRRLVGLLVLRDTRVTLVARDAMRGRNHKAEKPRRLQNPQFPHLFILLPGIESAQIL
jgi:heat shock protein HtpX